MKAHICAAIAFISLAFLGDPLTPAATAEPHPSATSGQGGRQQAPQPGNMRFRGMDRNNDGVITRDEWRGNDRAFRNNDWNGDGVLSGDEVRPGAQRNRNTRQQPAPAFDDWTNEGFRSLDTDRNGRITRDEWRYELAAFARADRNDDNVLTRAEFLGPATGDPARGEEDARFDERARFDAIDTNRNGRIERAEWRGTRDGFDWLDRNNDGWLSRAETVGNDVPPTTGTTGRVQPVRDVIVVNAQTRWTDTGIDVRAGDRLVFTAQGRVTLSGSGNDIADASGAVSGRRAPDAPLRQLPAGAVIARIGDGEPFFVGDRYTLANAPATGRLYLGVNDDYLGDNSGEFRVNVRVTR